MFSEDVIALQNDHVMSGRAEMPQVFPPVHIRRAHDPRLCPKCGYRLRKGDWPFCESGVGHEPVQQNVGHPIVMERRKD